ncbi:Short-chain dehydrogenase/reductase SDR [[Actinomadura] parvosata subsp. kistnae]|uniref:Short-chain dehydrogenase n=1 Tax=[Actinomadura] parvosata subsp. kistnae TaxID=1909395 RepID=A0A1U9ZWA0_9ACTN|nr:SDR family NAD(P)-dependent oxidoreductase [Nonomuraea sp. ATCC 55076]AQZ62189.1 short-chain dehydrogenase [Nonomuraea sp. ATCC 55076]SPL95950.1 Short-chain dehydrogenase/reductase SDR [Actinomadura parvosata subsp. kistnae]
MESFTGKMAVVTGGGAGIGRELVVQLAAEGCSVAACDLDEAGLAGTAERAAKAAPGGGEVRVTTHRCDVSDEAQVTRFRDEVVERHRTGHINLLFNNAGIGGGASFFTSSRAEWERTFSVCWGGVYNCTRAFMPLLVASDEGWLVNTSSVNGFWAAGPGMPMSAYSAAKFAVKGFSEAMLTDLRINAPHVQVALVMPGHVGTEIVINSRRIHGHPDPDDMTAAELAEARERAAVVAGVPADRLSDAEVRAAVKSMGEWFRDRAPLSAADAATVILDGVRAGTWRILVGDDARALDAAMRADPLDLYRPDSPTLAAVFPDMRPREE